MKPFKLIKAVWCSINFAGCYFYIAENDAQFEHCVGMLETDPNERYEITVRELVRFEVGDEPPPMIGSYYALYTDKVGFWNCWTATTLEELAKAKDWQEIGDLFYATEAIL